MNLRKARRIVETFCLAFAQPVFEIISSHRILIVWIAWLCVPFVAMAHVGSPNVFFEGKAGPYPIHVVIQPPEVIPGLAEISVRVEGQRIDRVTALPILWNAGRKGAPPPDLAKLVRGQTNLYNAQLWFMESGSQSVELELHGGSGTGRVTIPVDAVARRVLTMPKPLMLAVGGLGVVLAALLLSVIGAAVRESVLEPGERPPTRRRWLARGAMASGAVLLVLALWGGKHWWDAEAADYRHNRLYQAMSAEAQVRVEAAGRRILHLEINDPRFAHSSPLVPDHGKLMHLFLIQEPTLEAFAHLHPIKIDRKTFETVLPELPAGTFKLYADVTYETGFSDTLTTSVEIPSAAQTSPVGLDPDDSWRIASPVKEKENMECELSRNYVMKRSGDEALVVNQPVKLQFHVRGASGETVMLEPYLGMRGHLALRRVDGSVFTHLHPGGSPSMAAIQLSVLRAEGKLPLKAAFGEDDPICKLPEISAADQEWLHGSTLNDSSVAFPYAFPKPGIYRLWVQVKIKGEILTGVYDVEARLQHPGAPLNQARTQVNAGL